MKLYSRNSTSLKDQFFFKWATDIYGEARRVCKLSHHMWVHYCVRFSGTVNLSFLIQRGLGNIYVIPLVVENPRIYCKKQNNILYRISPANRHVYCFQNPQEKFNSVLEQGPVGCFELLRREKMCNFQSLPLRALGFTEKLGSGAASHLSNP